jgi:hypothetical protein
MEGKEITEIHNAFKDVTDLTISDSDGNIYGEYSNLVYVSSTVDADGNVTIAMHIKSDIEIRLAVLEETQAEQDEAIAELYGEEI